MSSVTAARVYKKRAWITIVVRTHRDWHVGPVHGKNRPVKALGIGYVLLAVLALASGCTRDIGDDCQTSVDCDPNGTRACDLSQPGGYCTIQGCNETSCPSGSACIRLFPVAFLTTSCNPACEDIPASTSACPTGPTNDCAADELCLDVGKCARRSLEQRYCAKNCGNDGDCRSGYHCQLTGGDDGSMALSTNPNQTTHYCAPGSP